MDLVTVVHIIVSILLIVVVLLQQGKGADVGATFGGGGQSMFGAAGADNLLTRFTTIVAAVFMITSVWLSTQTRENLSADGDLFKNVAPAAQPATEAPKNESQEAAPSAEAKQPEAAETVIPQEEPQAASPVEAIPPQAAEQQEPVQAAPSEASTPEAPAAQPTE